MTLGQKQGKEMSTPEIKRTKPRIGDMVQTGVFVLNEWVPMASGRIVDDHGGYFDVDVMSHHGGAPWVTQHTYAQVRPVKENR